MKGRSHVRVLFRGVTQGRGSVPADLQGPEFAILDPIIPEMRSRRPPRDPQRVLITLGGGIHVRAIGARLAGRIATRVPAASIDVVADPGGKSPSRPLPARRALGEASSRHAA